MTDRTARLMEVAPDLADIIRLVLMATYQHDHAELMATIHVEVQQRGARLLHYIETGGPTVVD